MAIIGQTIMALHLRRIISVKEIIVNTDDFLIPSVLRNFVVQEEGMSFLLDKKQPMIQGDIVLAELIDSIQRETTAIGFLNNYCERIIKKDSLFFFRNYIPIIGELMFTVIGNRFSTKICCGGAVNPVTGVKNSDIFPNNIVDNLGNFNVVGHLNYLNTPEKPAKVRVLGKLVNESMEGINLKSYKVFFEEASNANIPILIIVGDDTECGKTTCCNLLANAANDLNKRIVYYKITGGPRIRDMYSVLNLKSHFDKIEDEIEMQTNMPIIDFVDLGYVSSHTVDDYNDFSKESIALLNSKCDFYNADLAIIEFAGNIHQGPNRNVLAKLVENYLNIRVVAAIRHGLESMYSIVNYLQSLKFDSSNIYFSGCLTGTDFRKLAKDIALSDLLCNYLSSDESGELNNEEWRNIIKNLFNE